MTIYHKIGDYYGVLVDGMTMFSGSKDACLAYIEMFSPVKAVKTDDPEMSGSHDK